MLGGLHCGKLPTYYKHVYLNKASYMALCGLRTKATKMPCCHAFLSSLITHFIFKSCCHVILQVKLPFAFFDSKTAPLSLTWISHFFYFFFYISKLKYILNSHLSALPSSSSFLNLNWSMLFCFPSSQAIRVMTSFEVESLELADPANPIPYHTLPYCSTRRQLLLCLVWPAMI